MDMQPFPFKPVIGEIHIAMKKTCVRLLMFLALGLAIVGCQSPETVQPEAPAPKGRTFAARYIIPLTTGRPNGEADIIDAQHAEATNIAELRPVFAEVVAAAKAGTIPSYPTQGDPDPENNPKTYLQRQWDHMVGSGQPVSDENFLVGFELEYDGQAFDGYSKLKLRHIDLTWVDPGNVFPDFNLCRVAASDLQQFKVQKGRGKVPMDKYLEDRQFEHYVIRVYAPQDTFGIRTHADARTVQQKLDQGILDDINPWKDPAVAAQ